MKISIRKSENLASKHAQNIMVRIKKANKCISSLDCKGEDTVLVDNEVEELHGLCLTCAFFFFYN